jgi:hypothetical protein
MASFLDVCRFTPTLGGTTDWTFSSAVTGCQGPAAAGAVNGATYRYRAESADQSQWEIGTGVYNSGAVAFARTTVLSNSSATGTSTGQSGAGTKISFLAAPQVAIVFLAEDVLALPVSIANGGTGDTGTAWSAYTPTVTSQTGTPTTISASGRSKQIAKTIFVQATVLITTVGTAAGVMFVSLPVAPLTGTIQVLSGVENAVTGKTCKAFIDTGSSATSAIVTFYDNTTTWASSNKVSFTGVYESN